MSRIFDKSETSSSNMNNITIESEYKLSSFHSKISSIYNKKNNRTNIFNKRHSKHISFKKINIFHNFSHDNMNYSKSTNQSEENKTKLFLKENKENQVSSLFNNSFLREKQKIFRLNSINLKNYHISIDCNKNNNTYDIVDNNSKMFKSFLSKTKSNFNNKYNIIYSISDWKKKEQINKLFNSIKQYQKKNNFSNFLEIKANKRCLSAKKLKLRNNLSSNNNIFIKNILGNQTNSFLENIFHKNNLIKIKTLDFINNKPEDKTKRKDEIFHSNNIFFKTMPLKK